MTDTPPDLSQHTTETFRRHDHRTHVDETLWPFGGMRSLHVSYNDGLHTISYITHDGTDTRQTNIGIHRSEKFHISPNDDLASTLVLRAADGTPCRINLFGITLEQIADAVASAIAEKANSKEDIPT